MGPPSFGRVMTKLVIVESPAKTKTIAKYLPKGFVVESSVGHVRDLPGNKAEIPASIRGQPWADYGIDVDHEFEAHYITIKGKAKVIADLRKRLKDADELFLATDGDREGESISWHLVQALKPKVPVRRMVFHEITKEAIQNALKNPRDLDLNLVQAQETRRILDRLYGYTLSPLLWKKIGGNLSAGRVQSVAVRLVVQRERERRAFRTGSYWDLTAKLAKMADVFDAKLTQLEGKSIATGKDFDKDTGRIQEGKDVLLLEEGRARELQRTLPSFPWTVAGVESKERQSSPPAPFITSTLQQEGINRLNLTARETMRVAQRLYESGLITYMRTDSTTLSDEGMKGAREAVKKHFGDEYLHPTPRTYEHKQSASAQEAHEAIRPAGAEFVPPEGAGLSGKELAVYTMIWNRTVASQMANERFTSTTVEVHVDKAVFSATGKRVDFPGYRLAYPVSLERDTELPPLQVGDVLDCQDLRAEGHETKPPARYTEATLVKALEEDGVGRPSTYAEILDKIQAKNYVVTKGKALVPTLTAFAVTSLLEKHFPRLVDTGFTAEMEGTLDRIADGKADWLPYIKAFFKGPDGIKTQVDQRMDEIEPVEARTVDLEGLPYSVKVGRFGPYVETEVDGSRVSVNIPPDVTPDDITRELIEDLLRRKAEGPKRLGAHPENGEPIFLMDGRFGPYVQWGEQDPRKGAPKPKRASLPPAKTPDTITLEDAVELLKFPRELGQHPAGGRVFANMGRFGPFVAHEQSADKTDYRSLADEGMLHTVTLQEALDLLAQPKKGRGAATRSNVLKDLGPHPQDGKPVQILEGRYGPYVKHEAVNATVPKGTNPATLTMEQAVELLEKRKAAM